MASQEEKPLWNCKHLRTSSQTFISVNIYPNQTLIFDTTQSLVMYLILKKHLQTKPAAISSQTEAANAIWDHMQRHINRQDTGSQCGLADRMLDLDF